MCYPAQNLLTSVKMSAAFLMVKTNFELVVAIFFDMLFSQAIFSI